MNPDTLSGLQKLLKDHENAEKDILDVKKHHDLLKGNFAMFVQVGINDRIIAQADEVSEAREKIAEKETELGEVVKKIKAAVKSGEEKAVKEGRKKAKTIRPIPEERLI
ncbi:uncharacterized protein N7483_007322 [Penicillium malachiteum]|uniref:uncharacterized protein n=1 Tax=Penicillium malachiteum TaxID=1324776 RepID=UPI002548952D|nr:uncharacterized protein N7483_007322 [Penicillium malachiteum]KAJ5725965.1 hypothetical protein N7483_007322 [Penicillium malachiteum]